MPIPLEFTVAKRPASVNAGSSAAWQARVENVAQVQKAKKLGMTLGPASHAVKSSENVTVKIFFFPANRRYADVDNAIKPTIDGLKKALLRDDRNVQRVIVERFFPIAGATMKVAAEDMKTLGPVLMAQANASRALLNAVVVQAGIPLLHPKGKAAKDSSYATAIKVELHFPNDGNLW